MKRTLIAWLIGSLCATALAQAPSVQNPQPSKPFPSISSTASPVQVLGSDSIESTQNDTQSPLVLPIEELNKRVSRYGRIIDEIPMETPWLFAWLVERNGYQTTVYATPDGTHIIAGVLLNGGEQSTPSIVDQLKAKHSQAETTPLADTRASSTRSDGGTSSSTTADTLAQDDDNAQNLTYAMQGQFLKAVPAVINWADELKGFKEGPRRQDGHRLHLLPALPLLPRGLQHDTQTRRKRAHIDQVDSCLDPERLTGSEARRTACRNHPAKR